MQKLDVKNWKNETVGSVELDPSVFGVEVDVGILNEVVRWQRASRRSGTHMTKTRSLVSGGGKKPFKQKGTGNARQGSTRSPLMPGGGKLFGPSPRDYSYALPKKIRKLGLKMALSHLAKEGRLVVISDCKSDGKTKSLSASFKKIGLEKAVVVNKTAESALFARACRNLPKFKSIDVNGINVFDLLKYGNLVLDKSIIPAIVERVEVV